MARQDIDQSDSLLQMRLQDEGVDWRFIVFLTSGIATILSPYVLVPLVGIYWAAAAAICIWLLWCNLMPVSCINGGMIYSFFAMIISLNSIAMVMVAILRFMIAFFT